MWFETTNVGKYHNYIYDTFCLQPVSMPVEQILWFYLNVENLVELKKTQPTEHSKGRFTYTLLYCVLGVSFRGGGGGATQNLITVFENYVIRPVFQCKINKSLLPDQRFCLIIEEIF